jgi:hypothetical protein
MIMICIRWKSFLLVILTAIFAGSCAVPDQIELGIFLLRDDMRTDQFQAAELNDLDLLDQPLISLVDIISYNQATHAIELEEDDYRRIQDLFLLPVDVDGIPFVISVGGEPVYGGAFWTPASSLIFDGVTIMDPIAEEGSTIRLDLGYPSSEVVSGADPRSDSRIMEVLEAAGKLR